MPAAPWGNLSDEHSENVKYRETLPKIFEYLDSALSYPKIVKDCFKNNIDLVVTEMLLRISDPM